MAKKGADRPKADALPNKESIEKMQMELSGIVDGSYGELASNPDLAKFAPNRRVMGYEKNPDYLKNLTKIREAVLSGSAGIGDLVKLCTGLCLQGRRNPEIMMSILYYSDFSRMLTTTQEDGKPVEKTVFVKEAAPKKIRAEERVELINSITYIADSFSDIPKKGREYERDWVADLLPEVWERWGDDITEARKYAKMDTEKIPAEDRESVELLLKKLNAWNTVTKWIASSSGGFNQLAEGALQGSLDLNSLTAAIRAKEAPSQLRQRFGAIRTIAEALNIPQDQWKPNEQWVRLKLIELGQRITPLRKPPEPLTDEQRDTWSTQQILAHQNKTAGSDPLLLAWDLLAKWVTDDNKKEMQRLEQGNRGGK